MLSLGSAPASTRPYLRVFECCYKYADADGSHNQVFNSNLCRYKARYSYPHLVFGLPRGARYRYYLRIVPEAFTGPRKQIDRVADDS